jgi:hypothetical protein
VPVPSLQGHHPQNALRQVWAEDRQLAFERRHPLILLISHIPILSFASSPRAEGVRDLTAT